jgi:hypothetical protein
MFLNVSIFEPAKKKYNKEISLFSRQNWENIKKNNKI